MSNTKNKDDLKKKIDNLRTCEVNVFQTLKREEFVQIKKSFVELHTHYIIFLLPI